MRLFMNTANQLLAIGVLGTMLGACGAGDIGSEAASVELGVQGTDFERGVHGGRLLKDGAFALELAIFETGVPPEFRAWATSAGEPIDPNRVDLSIQLTRLGDRIDEIGFAPESDFLRGDTVVYEPHSFVVSIQARFGRGTHRWLRMFLTKERKEL